ncbi:uncharacterized protein LOC106882238 [Octopus bimaculoides]|uniref:uncharacterized protein LOC106882238 n=1 Tax=Octopus bimaculoides TaxID=37653 RepID=UPI00071D95A7|nr:uncharacterized protein LOC106882238 [Octopus bimaculoides]|eukprot:XP_014788329.1 PREDICTED: uncharacterized protein LOC106882238 [Octopus bimaculoides]
MVHTNPEKPKIVNLSNLNLSNQQIKILSKGLKFTPTPQYPNLSEKQDDVSQFCRKLRLAEEYFDKEINSNESMVRNKSNYNPIKSRNKTLDKFYDYISNFPYSELPQPKPKPNTSKREWEIIYELRNNHYITIKEADKGNIVVIMDTEQYKDSVSHLLQDYPL